MATVSRTLSTIACSAVILLPFASAVNACAQNSRIASLRVTNPGGDARPSEVLDLPLAQVLQRLHARSDVAVVARLNGHALLTQRYAAAVNGHPDRLLVLLDLAPRQSVTVQLQAKASAPVQQSLVHARKVPERDDDFAWENNVVAYRVYGPALEATGEIASGIDVWSKRVPDFVTESWYQRDKESARTHNPALSYHRDNGQGLDSYEVGSSRGCGGTAVFEDGKLIPSKNVTTSQILANGPIRTDFILNYAAWQAGSSTVHETKRITLDAGSKLNHMHSTFRFDGPSVGGDPNMLTVAAGVAMHRDAVLNHPLPSIVSVWDTPQLETAGHIGTAMVLPRAAHAQFLSLPIQGKIAGNAVFLFSAHSGDTIDYFAGSTWSKADTPTQEDFNRYLEAFYDRLLNRVTYHWTRGR